MTIFKNIIDKIECVFNPKRNRSLTAEKIKSVLLDMLATIGEGRVYAGIVRPEDAIPNHQAPVFYLINTAGNYIAFGNIVLEEGELAVVVNDVNNVWTYEVINKVYADIDANNVIFITDDDPTKIEVGGIPAGTNLNGESLNDILYRLLYGGTPVKTYRVYYNGNGGAGSTTDNNRYEEGEVVTVTSNAFTRNGYNFTSWNTKSDGSGISYRNGDTITVTTENIILYAVWEQISVVTYTGLNIVTPPTKVIYNEGESFDDTGMRVIALFSDGSSRNIFDYTVTNGTNLQSSNENIVIQYTIDSVTHTATQHITVNVVTLPVPVAFIYDSYKHEYNYGESFDPTSITNLRVRFDNGDIKSIYYTSCTFTPMNLTNSVSNVVMSYTENGTTINQNLEVTVQPFVIVLTLYGDINYTEGENFDPSKSRPSVVDGAGNNITNYTITNGTNLSVDRQYVTASYYSSQTGGASSNAVINVRPPALIDIELESYPNKTTYFVGQNFNPEGMVVNAIYEDNPSRGVPVTGYTIIGGNNLQLGTDEVIISYTEQGITKTYPLAITVQEVVVPESITYTSYDATYNAGEVFNITTLTGLQIVYSDGVRKSIVYTSLSSYSPNTALDVDDKQVTIYYTEDGVTIQTSLPIIVSAAVQYPTLTNPSLVVNTMQADKGSPLATYNNNIQSGVEIEIDITLNKGTINPDYSLTPPAVSDRIGEVDLASAILDPHYMGSGLDFVGVIVGESYATAILEQGGSETRWNVPLDCTLIVPYAAGKQPVDSAGNDYETPHPDGTFEVHNQGIDFAIAGVFANSSNIATPSLLDILYEDLTFDADEFLVGMQLELEFTSFETVDHKYELHLNSQLEITNVEIWDSFDEIWLPLSSYTFAVVGGEEGVSENTRIWRSTAPRNTNGALYRFTITEI